MTMRVFAVIGVLVGLVFVAVFLIGVHSCVSAPDLGAGPRVDSCEVTLEAVARNQPPSDHEIREFFQCHRRELESLRDLVLSISEDLWITARPTPQSYTIVNGGPRRPTYTTAEIAVGVGLSLQQFKACRARLKELGLEGVRKRTKGRPDLVYFDVGPSPSPWERDFGTKHIVYCSRPPRRALVTDTDLMPGSGSSLRMAALPEQGWYIERWVSGQPRLRFQPRLR